MTLPNPVQTLVLVMGLSVVAGLLRTTKGVLPHKVCVTVTPRVLLLEMAMLPLLSLRHSVALSFRGTVVSWLWKFVPRR